MGIAIYTIYNYEQSYMNLMRLDEKPLTPEMSYL